MVAIRYVKPISPSVMILPPQITYFIILLFFAFITRAGQNRQAIAQKVSYAIQQTAGNFSAPRDSAPFPAMPQVDPGDNEYDTDRKYYN
ncbi:MAG TPA: hypothetical protein ENI97_11745 [Gammaproteobacteria bacterium]|nr:hypothetical protein [Gammaproteobacteria bacterium]